MQTRRVLVPALWAALGCASSSPAPATTHPAADPSPAPVPAVAVHLFQDAQAAAQAGDLPRARELWRQAEAAGDEPVQSAVLLAQSHLQEDGDLASAEAALVRALARAPDHGPAGLLLGRVREGQGRWEDAAVLYRQAGERQPQDAQVFERLAAVSMARAQSAQGSADASVARVSLEEAVSAVGKARALAGDKPAYDQTEARAREALGDLAGAEAALRRWQLRDPTAPGPHRLLAEFYDRHGDAKKAHLERLAGGAEAGPSPRKLRPLKSSR